MQQCNSIRLIFSEQTFARSRTSRTSRSEPFLPLYMRDGKPLWQCKINRMLILFVRKKTFADNNKDKRKHKRKDWKIPNMCNIFRKQALWGYQIWCWEGVLRQSQKVRSISRISKNTKVRKSAMLPTSLMSFFSSIYVGAAVITNCCWG